MTGERLRNMNLHYLDMVKQITRVGLKGAVLSFFQFFSHLFHSLVSMDQCEHHLLRIRLQWFGSTFLSCPLIFGLHLMEVLCLLSC